MSTCCYVFFRFMSRILFMSDVQATDDDMILFDLFLFSLKVVMFAHTERRCDSLLKYSNQTVKLF